MKGMLAAVVSVVLAGSCFAQTARPKTEASGTNVIATVLGKKITANEKEKLDGVILGALLRKYAEENKIEPTEAELDAFVAK